MHAVIFKASKKYNVPIKNQKIKKIRKTKNMPQTITKSCLSKHDQQVLESIFNPLELTSALAPDYIDTDAGACLVDNNDQDELIYSADNLKQSKELELAAVELSEMKQLEEALYKFAKAIELTPQRSSIYNNRAQCLRLAGKDEEAFSDLHLAIEYGAKQFKTKCHALCQRGVLYRKHNKLNEARRDFEVAAEMGSKFAKAQLVEINPYAALCNQMLRQAFEQLK